MKIIKSSKNKTQACSSEQFEHESGLDGSTHKQSWRSESSAIKEPLAQKKQLSKRGNTNNSISSKSLSSFQQSCDVVISAAGADFENNAGSEIDIFDGDKSWDNVEYSRTNAGGGRFKKKNSRSRAKLDQSFDNQGLEASDSKSFKPRFAKSKSKKVKKANIEYQEDAPLVNGKKRRRSELENIQQPSALEQLIDPEKEDFNKVLARGMRLLAIREHSVLELTQKLIGKFEEVDACTIYAVVDELVNLKYLSDERFAETYVRSRGNKGFGPVKIKAELKSKGVSNSLIQDHLKESSGQWFDNAERQYLKKYGDGAVTDYNTWTKRARFMQSRGFTMEHIHVTLPKVEFD